MSKAVWTPYGFFWVTLALFLAASAVTGLSRGFPGAGSAFPASRGEGVHHPDRPRHARELAVGVSPAHLAGGRPGFPLPSRSPQSKEGDDRKEEKIDRILAAVAKDGETVIKEIDQKYPRT